MAQVGIREYDAKRMMSEYFGTETKIALVTPETDYEQLLDDNPWLAEDELVVKPDQLFGKRGKYGLIGVELDYLGVKSWITEKKSLSAQVGSNSGELTHFLIEPFIPHEQEYYLAIKSERENDIIFFSEQGGVEIEENWERVKGLKVGVNEENMDLSALFQNIAQAEIVKIFSKKLLQFYRDYHFTYLEINPFIIKDEKIIALDTVVKVDDTASFMCQDKWGGLSFPVVFGKTFNAEENYIRTLDEKSGASLKLIVLNPIAKIWTMVAGGGASVIYADTISDLGFGKEMANYGEYSGDPSMELTYEYARTILDLMTRNGGAEGKVLIIGGGIANFTDIAKTFAGIVKAIREFRPKLEGAKIFIRRGGPNYREGLKMMRDLGKEIKLPIEVYGPGTHMTEIVNLAVSYIN